MANELPIAYHAARNNYMTNKMGGEMTQNPVVHVTPPAHQTRAVGTGGRNAPTSLHNTFGATGKR